MSVRVMVPADTARRIRFADAVEHDPDIRLLSWAARHHGLFRAGDALDLGLTHRQLQYRVRQGRVERLGHGVFRIGGTPTSREQELLSAAWRSRGVVSHRSALELHGLIVPSRRKPHVTVGRRAAHAFDAVIGHRSADLISSDTSAIHRIPVTTAARTLVDVGNMVSELELESAVHRALHAGLTSIAHLDEIYERVARRGRNGVGAIGALLQQYDPAIAAAESVLEVVILRVLRRHGVPEPVRQHVVELAGQVFRLDLAYPWHKVFLEGDGFGVHGARHAFESDRRRQNLLVLEGWWPIRITWREAHRDPAGCAALVKAKLAEVERSRT